MASVMAEAGEKWKTLEATWTKQSSGEAAGPALAEVEKMVEELKVMLIVKAGLVPLLGLPKVKPSSESHQAAVLYRSVLEVSAQVAAVKGNKELFQRAMDQVLVSYQSSAAALPEPLKTSDKALLMMGLRLMGHLADKNLGAFHMALDRIPPKDQESVYVAWPKELEEALTMGTYGVIIKAKASMPSPLFRRFWDGLVETVRGDIAGGFEAAYETLSVGEAGRLLFFPQQEAEKRVAAMGKERGWPVDGDQLLFGRFRALRPDPHAHPDDAADANLSASHQHAKRLLSYAAILEAIP